MATAMMVSVGDFTISDVVRFWSYVNVPQDVDLCWEWTAPHKNRVGGQIKVRGRKIISSRASYALCFGTVPASLLVCHHCDNPLCCNPHHLFLGTSKDNTQDMLSKGRGKFKPCDPRVFNIGKWRATIAPFIGETHPRARLTNAQAAEIRRLALSGVKGVDIAKQFNCSFYTVSNIKLGKQWKHV